MALQKKDVPGASLCGRDPSELKILELKRWLACRGAPLKGEVCILLCNYRVVNGIFQVFTCLH